MARRLKRCVKGVLLHTVHSVFVCVCVWVDGWLVRYCQDVWQESNSLSFSGYR